MTKQCGRAHGSQSCSEPHHHHISLSVEGPEVGAVIFSIPHRLSASSKIPVNFIITSSVIVVVTGNGDKGWQREVRQHESPFLKGKKMATDF